MTTSLLDYYKAIERTSGEMLAAARISDWEQVTRLEGSCAVLIEQLRECARRMELTPGERAAKQRLMLSILRNDARIRELLEASLDDGLDFPLAAPAARHLH